MLPNVTKMLPKKSKKSKKEPKFYCLCCDFTTSKKGNWERHLATQKHKKNMLPIVTKTLPKKSKKSFFIAQTKMLILLSGLLLKKQFIKLLALLSRIVLVGRN